MAVVWAEDSDQLLIRSVLETLPGAPRVRFANDGAEAVDLIQQSRPRLIVLDVNMPRVDGIEALRRIKAQQGLQGVPVVMFSNPKNQDEVKACSELGVQAFVQKPMRFDEFAKAVRGIVALAA